MKKKLLTLTVLGACLYANAQILSYLDSNAIVYVGKNALVYNGGGMKIKNNAQVLNYGNVMIVGSNTDVFKTVTTSDEDKTETNGGVILLTSLMILRIMLQLIHLQVHLFILMANYILAV